jgi:hypothetical protein
MGRVLRVHDCLTLPDVLGVLAPEACSLHWSVLDLGEVVPGEGWDMRVPYREPRVLESSRGWRLTFAELVAFGEWASQVIDGVFVASVSSQRLPRRSDDDTKVIEQADMVVAAVDSSFWYVSASDDVVARAAGAFHKWIEVEPVDVRLSTWGRADGDEERCCLSRSISLRSAIDWDSRARSARDAFRLLGRVVVDLVECEEAVIVRCICDALAQNDGNSPLPGEVGGYLLVALGDVDHEGRRRRAAEITGKIEARSEIGELASRKRRRRVRATGCSVWAGPASSESARINRIWACMAAFSQPRALKPGVVGARSDEQCRAACRRPPKTRTIAVCSRFVVECPGCQSRLTLE